MMTPHFDESFGQTVEVCYFCEITKSRLRWGIKERICRWGNDQICRTEILWWSVVLQLMVIKWLVLLQLINFKMPKSIWRYMLAGYCLSFNSVRSCRGWVSNIKQSLKFTRNPTRPFKIWIKKLMLNSFANDCSIFHYTSWWIRLGEYNSLFFGFNRL